MVSKGNVSITGIGDTISPEEELEPVLPRDGTSGDCDESDSPQDKSMQASAPANKNFFTI